LSIVIGILIFSFLVISHEFGHFLFAKYNGIGVIEFSVGMGPRIFSFEKGGTQYSLKLIPFGGSCAMVGEDEENYEPDSFQSKSVWARISVVFGGPLFNFVFAFLLAIVLILCDGTNPAQVYHVEAGYAADQAGIREGDVIKRLNGRRIRIGRDIALCLMEDPLSEEPVQVTYSRDGETYETVLYPAYTAYQIGITYQSDTELPTLSKVSADSPAEEAGLKAGDQVLSMDGSVFSSGEDMKNWLAENPPGAAPFDIVVLRDGKEIHTSVTPREYTLYSLGMSATYYIGDPTVLTTVTGAFHEVGYGIRTVFISLKMLFNGTAKMTDLSGPVGIVSVIDTTVQETMDYGLMAVFTSLLNLSILLSANLGIMNLLPIPALDGGRLLVLFGEVVTRRRLPQKVETGINIGGFVLLMLLMAFILFNDVIKLVR